MTTNRYVFDTTLDGYINVSTPGGKYNNCSFSFTMPKEVVKQAEEDRVGLLEWAKAKAGGRVNVNISKWDEDGYVKYSFDGDTNRARPVFIDTQGDVLSLEVLGSVRKGTKARLIVQQVPYTKPSVGTTLKVLGVQITELVSGGSSSSTPEPSSPEEVAEIFGKIEGFTQPKNVDVSGMDFGGEEKEEELDLEALGF